MLTSSLLGVKKLLHLLPDSDRNLLEDRLTQLISSAKFWKYSKHKTPQVTTSNHHCSVVKTCLNHLILEDFGNMFCFYDLFEYIIYDMIYMVVF